MYYIFSISGTIPTCDSAYLRTVRLVTIDCCAKMVFVSGALQEACKAKDKFTCIFQDCIYSFMCIYAMLQPSAPAPSPAGVVRPSPPLWWWGMAGGVVHSDCIALHNNFILNCLSS